MGLVLPDTSGARSVDPAALVDTSSILTSTITATWLGLKPLTCVALNAPIWSVLKEASWGTDKAASWALDNAAIWAAVIDDSVVSDATCDGVNAATWRALKPPSCVAPNALTCTVLSDATCPGVRPDSCGDDSEPSCVAVKPLS